MDKKFADDMIAQFQRKFFGFALSKCNDSAEAEELAARITCEAYITLRTVEDVYNWEGYLHRIASNVYARYVNERIKNKSGDIAELEVESGIDFEADYIKREELELLKREVAWLGKRHREIVLLHYYHNKKLAEIAEMLDLPEGTVKWHLSDAKKILKKGMKKVRTEGTLGLEPIELIHMGNMGSPGPRGDTNSFLNSKLRQNIAYAAYFEPKTIEEIAKELNVSPVFIEDEVEYLEEWGFLDLMPGQKYRTNIYIDCTPYEVMLSFRELATQVANMICEEYIPELIKWAKDYPKADIYIPDDDINYFFWLLVPLALTHNTMSNIDWGMLVRMNYIVQRKDGGSYAAVATRYQEEVEKILEKEYICGPMCAWERDVPLYAWSLGTKMSDREPGWEDNLDSDYVSLVMVMNGKMPKTEAVLDKYVRLYERGLLRQGDDSVNVIVVKERPVNGFFADIEKNQTVKWEDAAGSLGKYIPQMGEEVLAKIDKLCEQRVQIEKQYYPKHMHVMLETLRKAKKINVIMVIEELLKRGILKPLTEDQKKGVMTVVYSEILPGE